jgi:hypothetical protein
MGSAFRAIAREAPPRLGDERVGWCVLSAARTLEQLAKSSVRGDDLALESHDSISPRHGFLDVRVQRLLSRIEP